MSITNWDLWRKCPVCHARTSAACMTRSGSGNAHYMLVPHKTRKPRVKRGRQGPSSE